MKILYWLTLLGLITIYSQCKAQKFTINGTIKDKNTGENLIGATLFNMGTKQGTIANSYGFYSFTQPKDSIYLRISYVGYEIQNQKFLLHKDTTVNIELVSGVNLNEIVVTATIADKIQESSRMSTIDVPLEQIKALPAFMGEVDIFKVLQLLPGVQAGTEGSSGLYVRGGGPDQNLILLDGVPVYNASHLFGFFSAFNADAINHVELVKGGFPARYGGRLSSVIDINMKEGNTKKFKGEGSIGLIASRLTLEGPLIKNNTSFIVSARRTYVDLLTRPFMKKNDSGKERVGYYFYDLNAKINHQINAKNRVLFSAYSGKDKGYTQLHDQYDRVKDAEDQGIEWGNFTTALRWNSIITNKLFSNVTAIYSRYKFDVSYDYTRTETIANKSYTDFYHSEYKSGIRDYGLKVDLDYLPNPNHYIKFGSQITDHLFSPGALSYSMTAVLDTTLGSQITKAKEFSIYLEDDFLITSKLKMNAGMHASGFYVENKYYKSLQPRLSLRFLITPEISLKTSYAQMTQFIHLLTNAGIGLPTDLWVPATAQVGPERSYLSSAGIAYNLNNKYDFSIEGYYKKMKGLIEYKNGASYLNVENNWQRKVEIGRGESYGGEFLLQKKTGRISGWIGYTLSWTNRTFSNINNGKTFPYKYDRRHDIKVATIYQVNKHKEFSLTWVYGTGAAVTIPQSTFELNSPNSYNQQQSLQYYGNRNDYRMRAYHRMDLNYVITRKTKWGERSWSFGVYNIYNRKNPFFISTAHDKNGNKKFIQYSFFPIVPSIAYRFKF